MSITDSLSQLFTSFEFWRFYCVAIFAIIAMHTIINLVIDNVFESTRWIHITLFLLFVAPLSFGISGIYFSPFASKTSSALPQINSIDNKSQPKKVEKALPKITIIANTNATDDSKPTSETTPTSDNKATEAQLPPSTHDDTGADAELIKEFRDAIK